MMTSNTNIVMPQRSSVNDSHFMGGSATSYSAINPNFTEYRKRMLREQRFYNRAVKRLRKFLIEGFTLRDA